MTLPTIYHFLEDVKLRSSIDSVSDHDDSVLLHPPKARDIPSSRPRNKYLLLLTHILTSLLTILTTLFLASSTQKDNSNGLYYDKFNAPCKLSLPSQNPKATSNLTHNSSHHLRATPHPIHRRHLRLLPLVPLSLQRPSHAGHKLSMAGPPLPRNHIRQRLGRLAHRPNPQLILRSLPRFGPRGRGALRGRRRRCPPRPLPALPLAGPPSAFLSPAGGDEEGGAGYVREALRALR